MQYQDKVCVITGSSAGIGFAIARNLGKQGGKIVISSRNKENVSSAVNELRREGIICEGVTCHVSKDRKKLIDFAIEKFGGIDILVNNAAAMTDYGAILDISEENYSEMMDINVKSAFFLIKEALPHLKKSQGKIIFISSVVGYRPLPIVAVYSMCKASLINMTKFLAIELAGSKIRVNCIAPAVIDTKFAEAIVNTPEAKKNAFRRVGTAEECAETVSFLCSNHADYISGETILLGGLQTRL